MKLPKLPGIPFVGQKFLLKRRTLEGEGPDKGKYEMRFTGDLPENTIKLIYNQLLKKKNHGLSFESGFRDGQTMDVPISFFNQKAGVYSWKETILRQLDKHFREVRTKLGWIFITKSFKLFRISRKGSVYSIYIEVIGEKTGKQ